MKKKLTLIWVLLIISILVEGCAINSKNVISTTSTKKDIELNIETTDKLLYCAVKEIVGDKHMVEYMFSREEDMKNFTFTDDSLNNIQKKDLFIYYDAGFEPWSDKFIEKMSKTNLGIISASRGVKISTYSSDEKNKATYGKDIPYYWLNMDNYKIVLQNIKNAVEEKDPKNRELYEKNFSVELKKLDKYQKQLKDIVTKLKAYTFIVNGDELDYFLKYTGIKYVKIQDNNYEDVIQKTKGDSKLIYMYCDDAKLGEDSLFVKVNSLNTVKLCIYDDKKSYEEIFLENINSLKEIKK